MPHNTFCYAFEQYRLDVAQRVLTREGQSIPLTPKATDVLLLLLQNAGQLIEKDELINQVWPDAFVEEANLTQNIFQLRRALKDDGSGPKYIETVARRGYRFVAPVKRVAVEVVQPEDLLTGVRKSAIPILAVLPLANATGNIELQYLAEGIPESIINSLSRLSQLRVISRSSAFRYKNRQVDPQTTGKKLGADVLLVGTISGRESALAVSVELVSVENAWQLWGQTFKVDSENIFEVQDEITREISRVLRLPLTREDETQVAKRYTENPQAYQTYLEGRYYWSQYTKVGIEKAILHFERAIDLDPNYALAYAGVVDCYLRLVTNYLPPEDALPLPDGVEFESEIPEALASLRTDGVVLPVQIVDEKVKLRHEWDWKGAERELRRANELRTDYPAAHQWHAAYKLSKRMCHEFLTSKTAASPYDCVLTTVLPPSEEVQVLCAVAREQIEVGNYEGGCLALRNWWRVGYWPRSDALTPYCAADLLFTTGTLAHCVASTGNSVWGHKYSEALLNGSLALCEMLSLKTRAAEVRIELAACYYRQGFFDLARRTLEQAQDGICTDQDLTTLCLFRLAVVDRHAGRLQSSINRFREAKKSAEASGPWILGRYHQEFGTTLRDLATAETRYHYLPEALESFHKALYEFEAVGNHRYVAAVRNNIGYVLLALGRLDEAERELQRARNLFRAFGDTVRSSQVEETMTQLYMAQEKFELAEQTINAAVNTLEHAKEDALLAESLLTHGQVLLHLNRQSEAKRAFEGAYRVAERCGHDEGAGIALLLLLETLPHRLLPGERVVAVMKMRSLLEHSQQSSVKDRVEDCVKRYASS